MPSNHLIGDWNKTLVRTIGAPDSRLLTDASNPFVCASWRVAASTGSSTLEPDGENVRSPAKQRPEELDLSLRGRVLGDQLAVLIQGPNLFRRSTLRNGNVHGHTATVGTKTHDVYFAVACECGKKRRAKILNASGPTLTSPRNGLSSCLPGSGMRSPLVSRPRKFTSQSACQIFALQRPLRKQLKKLERSRRWASSENWCARQD